MMAWACQQLGGECLRFFGKLVASLSHELNNVLAIINELNGLFSDFLAAAESGRPLDQDRLKNVTERIASQVDRGKEYVKLLNRFAHTVDEPRITRDAREMVSDTISVCQRLTTLKKITMERKLPGQPVPVEGSPFDLYHALYRSIDLVSSALKPGSKFAVRLEPSENGFLIGLSGPDPATANEELDDKLKYLKDIIKQMGGSVEEELDLKQAATATKESGPLSLILRFPSKLDPLAFQLGPEHNIVDQ